MLEPGVLLILGSILAISVVIAHIAGRMGVPSLVAFLVLGMALGANGLDGADFHSVEMARTVGTIGLLAILFEGGLSTSFRRLRQVALPAMALSTIGVVVTAIVTGLVAHTLFNLPWAYSMLIGAVVSSTDAAAVFATLRFTRIRRKIARTLEAETGGNDPAAIALTIGFITWIQHPEFRFMDMFQLMVHELGIGLLMGVALGLIARKVFAHLPHSVGSFAPVASISACILAYSLTDFLGGSGFLAVYLVGLAIGSTPSRYRGQLTTFHEGLAFLAQVAMFIILGLFVVPKDLLAVAIPSIALSVVLILIARPLAVYLSTFKLGFSLKEKALLGYAGLRGAVPIVLGTFVLSAHLPYGQTIFNSVFFIVLTSALIQGTTLERVAKKLKLTDELPPHVEEDFSKKIEKIRFAVAPTHAISEVKIKEVGLLPKAKIIQIKRGNKTIEPEPNTIIKPGDSLIITAPLSLHPEVEDVFSRWRRRI